ncbi:MAG: OmpA family protein [Myxococcales bacterium]|nr:OmpA family protein [Myxococcales bacterium]
MLLLLASTGCDSLFGLGDVHSTVGAADAGLGPWSTPVAEQIAFGIGDDPTLPGDMLELYFNLDDDIYLSTRPTLGDPWSSPVPVAELNSTAMETTPEISRDGLTMFFGTARPGSLGLDDLMFSTRPTRADAWSPPAFVPELNSPASEDGGAISEDGFELVFTSTRSATKQIYTSRRFSRAGLWPAPVPETQLDSVGINFSAYLSPDRLTIYWSTNRAGTYDIYQAHRAHAGDPYSNIIPVAEANTSDDETDPWISPDGHDLYFVRATTTSSMLMHATR